ncbi:unnamed protein product [Citrullus colocynthis]|uniref:Uncharacterized protein n=1 Tax=Citrullus colocynthis TaxID=252529 RepID=A0ABP0Z4H4_9ROSI
MYLSNEVHQRFNIKEKSTSSGRITALRFNGRTLIVVLGGKKQQSTVELGDLIRNIVIVPTKKHGNATAKDIESGFLLLDHPQASLSKSGFPAVSEAELR